MLRSVPPALPPRSIDPRVAAALILGYLDSCSLHHEPNPRPVLLSCSLNSSNPIAALTATMMLPVRLSSAVARRAPVSPATPPLLLPRLSSTSSSSFSLSTTTTTSPARAYSSRATTSIHKTPLSSSSSSRWSGVSSFNLSQTRTMALDGKKIQVKNPVVELDGDEV